MKKAFFFCSILVLTLYFFMSCYDVGTTPDDENGGLNFEIRALTNPADGVSRAASRNYLPANGGGWFSPDSFIIKLGTVAINDEAGNFLELFDRENDEDCISLDLGAGENLSDLLDMNADYNGECIGWIGFALLPEIEYSYTDSSGESHTGMINLPVGGGNGYYYDIGAARGRAAFDIDLYEPDSGWEDTRLFFTEGSQNLTLFFDLENIILDSDEDGTAEGIAYEKAFYAVTDSCQVNYFYFRNASADEEIYPYRLTIIETAERPVFGKVFFQGFTSDATESYEIDELASFDIDDHDSRDSCLSINTDGSYDIHLSNGNTISGLNKDSNQSMTIGGTDTIVKYEKVF